MNLLKSAPVGSARRRRQWMVAISLWILFFIILLLSCDTSVDADIIEVDRNAEPVTMTVSVGPDVGEGVLLAWVSKECREFMVLPPISPVPVMVWQRDGKHTGRQGRIEYQFRCTRP